MLPGKFSPSRGRSRESGKIKLSKKFFWSPSLSKELAGSFLWVHPKRILESPLSDRSWEGDKYKDQGNFSLGASKLMPHCRSPRFFLSRLRNGANYLIGSSRGSDSEPISKAKTPLTALPQPSGLQNDIFSENVFASRFRRCSSSYRRTFIVFSLHPLTATLRAEKRHGFLDFFEKIFALRFHRWS